MIRHALELGYSKTLGYALVKVPRGVIAPGTKWLKPLYLVGLAVFSSGITSALLSTPPSAQGLLIYPGPGAQSIPETLIYACITLLGFAGVYTACLSGQRSTKPQLVNAYVAASLLMLTTSIIMGMTLVNIAGG
ncbi:MAG: hypothetical protein KGI26_05215 [Thaumarchaeota archaeon]|nr:hypothetical protein [Nitrososphaerota archaeon]